METQRYLSPKEIGNYRYGKDTRVIKTRPVWLGKRVWVAGNVDIIKLSTPQGVEDKKEE